MRVLIACEFSGVVRDAFIENGHDAWSCDLRGVVPEGKYWRNHLYGNCLTYLNQNWDMMIAHPPCTYLANSGVRWLHGSAKRQIELKNAAVFFNKLLNSDIKYIAVENPIMHKYAKQLIKTSPTQRIQPWQFGHNESKCICLWLKNLPELMHTDIVSGRYPKTHLMGSCADRGRERSRFFPNIAEAMAKQWGELG